MAKTFFITGVSTGFGRELAQAALNDGHRVVGTVRRDEDRAAFDAVAPGRSFGRILDVTETAAMAPLAAEVERNVGAVDVLINNAGYGLEGVLEELPLDKVRHQFDVNFFGVIALVQVILPFMRARRAGRIVNITSMGAYLNYPGVSIYCASKAALESLSEALAREVKDFGIRVTAVAPGAFRTDWAGRSLVRGGRTIDDYNSLFDPPRERRPTGFNSSSPTH